MKGMMFSGSENVDYSQSTKKTFSSRKVFLLIMSILAAVSDFILLIVFAVAGHGGVAVPVLLLILDGLFIAGVCLSNFRFKYSIGVWTAYIVVSVIITSFLALLESDGRTYMTNIAKALNAVAHVVLYLSIIFAAIYPLFKKNIKLKAAITTCVAVSIVLVGVFTVFSCVNGYFGQGFVGGSRVVGYTLDEESDTYIATSIKAGNSDRVVIPAQFNGKTVSGVDCSIFTDNSVSIVEIMSSNKVNLHNPHAISDINHNIKIGVDKKYIDVFRERGLKEYASYGIYNDGMLTFANALYPVNLASDEVYVTFKYQDYPEGDIIPTWIGKSGEAFDFSFTNVNYAQHVDATDSGDLIWCYLYNDAKILSGDSVNLVGKEISENVFGAVIDFENVYKVSIEEDNDEAYEMASSNKTTVYEGDTYDVRFITVSTASAALNDLQGSLLDERGDAFLLTWQYNINSVKWYDPSYFYDDNWYDFIDLNAQLSNLANYGGKEVDIKIKPVWELKAPTDLTLKFNKSGYVYGDDVKIELGSITAPLDNCQLQYKWIWNGSVYSQGDIIEQYTTETFEIDNAYPRDGIIQLVVTISCPSVTSLESYSDVASMLVVNKRAVNLTWQSPSDMVYSGSEKTVSYAVQAGDLINGDTLIGNVTTTNLSNTNAGTYSARVTLSSAMAEKYYIAVGATYSYTIARRSVTAQWSNLTFVYDGASHIPTATAQGVSGGNISVVVAGSKVNAGNYTATATSGDSNYVLANPSSSFVINQKSVTAVWDNSTITYNGYAQYPSVAAINGLVSGDNIASQIIYSGYTSNIAAGDGYTVSAGLPSTSNYKFDAVQSTTYSIAKKALSIRAVAPNKTYDGKVNTFDFEVSGLASVHTKSSLGAATYSGEGATAVNAGTYSISVSLPVNDVTKNYDIAYTGATFTISKAQVSLSWTSSSVNNGRVTAPSVVTSGQAYSGDINVTGYTYRDSSNNVISSVSYKTGWYYVEAAVTSNNYDFQNTVVAFYITAENAVSREVA